MNFDVIFNMLKIRSLIKYRKNFHLENSNYGFQSQSGRSGDSKIAFVATLAKPNRTASILHTIPLFVLPILSFFISSRVDKASAADTVDFGSITGLVKPKLEKSLYSYPASRLNISNEMGSVKLSLCVVGRWRTTAFCQKMNNFFTVC